jgi:LysM repeat protein
MVSPSENTAGHSSKWQVKPPSDAGSKTADTMTKIAQTAGVALSDLEAANPGVDANKLQIGQQLKMPMGN